MTARADYLAILEASYQSGASDDAWLCHLLDVAAPLLQRGHGYGFWMLKDTGTTPFAALAGYRGVPLDPAQAMLTARKLDATAYRTLWYPPRPLVFISELLPKLEEPSKPLMDDYVRAVGVADMLGVNGHPTLDTAFVLWSGVPGKIALSGSSRDALHRVRIHLESALRLRLLGPARASAVLTPSGRIEHIEPESCGEPTRATLTKEARNLERLRECRNGAQQHHALVAWQALVEGRWSLVPHLDTDGKRSYYVFENPPHAVAYRALTSRESVVVDLYSRGLSGKYVAYSLGLSEAAVFQCLASAAVRLGFRNRTDLVRFAANRRRSTEATHVAPLTDAEREVLCMVQQGMSNRDIALAR